jgi:hypothetical protein
VFFVLFSTDGCIGHPIMVQGPTWDVDAPLDNPTENAYVQCSGPLGDNNYARPKLGYTKQIGGYCQLHCEVSRMVCV